MRCAVGQIGTDLAEDLQLLEIKLKQVKNEYDQYFLGSRKREPQQLRAEVQRITTYYSNISIQNTAQRFKFNSLRARFFTYRRLWDDTLRKMEEGRYARHLFKAGLRERERNEAQQRSEEEAIRQSRDAPPAGAGAGAPDRLGELFERYKSAREKTGQGAAGLSREKLEGLVKRQTEALRARYGVEKVRFKVVVEDGRAKLKAKPIR